MVPDRPPPDYYSTLDPDSYNSKLGRWGEGTTISKLEKLCDESHRLESTTTSDMRSRLAAINNSQLGDILVLHLVRGVWVTKHTIEVKVSGEHRNATISIAEYDDSRAKFLVAITLAGMWATTMEEVRQKSIPHGGRFYIVPYDAVRKVQLSETVR